MKRFLKIAIILFALIILIGGGIIAYLVATVDTEQVKQQVSSSVQEQTGRQLEIEGPLELSVFPWLGFKIGPTRFGNRAGFEGDFARFQHAEARIKLMPLFSKQVQMSKLIIDGFDLNLRLRKDGVNNWDDLSRKGAGRKPDPGSGTGNGAAAGGISLLLEGVEVRNAGVRYQDAGTPAAYTLTDFNLTTGAIELQRDIPFDLGFRLQLTEPDLKGDYRLAGVALIDLDSQQISLRDLLFETDLKAGGLPVEQIRSALKTSLLLDQQSQSLSLKPFDLQIDLQGQDLPKQALQLKLKAEIKANLKTMAADLPLLNLTLPAGTISGTAAYQPRGKGQQIDFDLKSDLLDLNRMLPPAAAKEEPAPTAKVEKTSSPAEPNPALRQLVVNGDIAIAKILQDKIEATDIQVRLRMKDGIARLNPVTAKVYGGLVQKDVRIDLRGAAPKIAAKAEVKGFEVGDYLKAAMDKDIISGQADLSADLKMTAADADSIKRTLNGTASLIARNGALKGVNIPDLIRRAKAALSGQSLPAASLHQTDFTELSGSARIVNGRVNNPDFSMKSPLLRIAGNGDVHLVKESIDYRVSAKLVTALSGQGGDDLKDLVGLPIPIHVTGSFNEPEWKLDLESAVREKVKAEGRKVIDKALADPEKALADPKGLLEDPQKSLEGFKGLFRSN